MEIIKLKNKLITLICKLKIHRFKPESGYITTDFMPDLRTPVTVYRCRECGEIKTTKREREKEASDE